MIDAAITKPPAFDVVVVHSFSRFFRGQFQLEFHVRRLAKSGVCLVSITQELGDDPMSNMIRQIIALFDEYQSKENAKHALRAMKENARQGFWNDQLRALAQRIEVDAKEVRIIGSKRVLLRTLVATESAKNGGFWSARFCTEMAPMATKGYRLDRDQAPPSQP